MKKILPILFFLVFAAFGTMQVRACVNLDINVGAVDTVEGRLFAEIISTFIHERTGTKSIMKFYADPQALHAAIKDKEVELIIANINDTLKMSGTPLAEAADDNFAAAKEFYKKDMQLVLLKPFGQGADSMNAGFTSSVLGERVLEKFPALPRLLKKLSGKIDSETISNLLASVKDQGKKPGRVAKDFLVSKRLI